MSRAAIDRVLCTRTRRPHCRRIHGASRHDLCPLLGIVCARACVVGSCVHVVLFACRMCMCMSLCLPCTTLAAVPPNTTDALSPTPLHAPLAAPHATTPMTQHTPSNPVTPHHPPPTEEARPATSIQVEQRISQDILGLGTSAAQPRRLLLDPGRHPQPLEYLPLLHNRLKIYPSMFEGAFQRAP